MPLKELADRRNLLHRKSDPQTVLTHALNDLHIGNVAVVSSFGAESVVLLHMVAKVNKATPVLFIDTEMLFEETTKYQKTLANELGLTDIRTITPSRSAMFQRDVDGLLHQYDVDACCALRKVEPLERALGDFHGWVTGRKRFQGGERTNLPLFKKDGGKIKINPLANWSREDITAYMDTHDLPRHPLVAKGFPSIGCQPCTTRVSEHEVPRAGRWRNSEKTECGIHFEGGKIVRTAEAQT